MLSRNLILVRVLGSLHGARFGLAVWVLYYLLFTDYAGIGLVEAATLVTAFLVEVPTGLFADAVGRRRTLALGFAVLGAGYLLLATVSALPQLLLSLVVLALGRALYSGTFEALLYDSLEACSAAQRFPTELLRVRALDLATSAATMIVGGILYAHQPRLPYLVTAATMLAAMVVALMLKEPPREMLQARLRIARQGGDSWRLILGRMFAAGARPTILPLLCIGALGVATDEILDDVLAVELGFGPEGLGLLFAAVYLVAAAAGILGGRWVERSPPRRLALILGTILSLSLLPSPWIGMGLGGLAIALRAAARSVLDVAASTAVNALVPSSVRATALSSFTLLRNAPYIACAYAIGSLMDRITGLHFATAFGLASMLVIGLLATVRFGADRRPGGNATSPPHEFGSPSDRS